MNDNNEILSAIAALGARVDEKVADVMAAVADVRDRVDALAEISGKHFDRVDSALESLQTDVMALRFDVAAHRVETRATFNRHEARLRALEAENA